tara:strand:- start:1001 stop:1534 length:534 start_codon:yes stop_codon:yes gene_type:complete
MKKQIFHTNRNSDYGQKLSVYGLFIVILLMTSTTTYAKMLVATCEAPKGWRVDIGPPLTNPDSKDIIVETGEDGISGTQPVFFIDLDEPEYLVEVLDPLRPPGVPEETIRKYNPEKVKKYRVVQLSDKQISAIDPYSQGIWTYALYPHLGYVTMSRQSHSIDGHGVSSMLYAKCEVQ